MQQNCIISCASTLLSEFDFKLSLCPVIYNVSINTRVDKNEKRFGITSRGRNIDINDG